MYFKYLKWPYSGVWVQNLPQPCIWAMLIPGHFLAAGNLETLAKQREFGASLGQFVKL